MLNSAKYCTLLVFVLDLLESNRPFAAHRNATEFGEQDKRISTSSEPKPIVLPSKFSCIPMCCKGPIIELDLYINCYVLSLDNCVHYKSTQHACALFISSLQMCKYHSNIDPILRWIFLPCLLFMARYRWKYLINTLVKYPSDTWRSWTFPL